MKKNKKAKKALIKRRIRRMAYTALVLVTLFCVVFVSYKLLLAKGIIKSDSQNQIKQEMMTEPNTNDVGEEEIKNRKDEKVSEPNPRYVYKGVVTGTIDDADTTEEGKSVSEEEDTVDTTPKDIEVKTIGEVKQENVEAVREALKLLPQEIKDSYVEITWEVYVTRENLQKVYKLDKPAEAITDHTNHLTKYEDRQSISVYTVLHENGGHYLEFAIFKITGVNPSQTPEFMQIYEEEAPTFKVNIEDPGYIITDSREFYAEMVCYYILDPSKCTPKAYQYIESQLNILKEKSS